VNSEILVRLPGGDPESWHFVTGPLDEVKTVSRQFGLNFWPDEGYFTHSLHTLVIDRRGRPAADFEGNQFTARQLGDYVEVLISAGSAEAMQRQI